MHLIWSTYWSFHPPLHLPPSLLPPSQPPHPLWKIKKNWKKRRKWNHSFVVSPSKISKEERPSLIPLLPSLLTPPSLTVYTDLGRRSLKWYVYHTPIWGGLKQFVRKVPNTLVVWGCRHLILCLWDHGPSIATQHCLLIMHHWKIIVDSAATALCSEVGKWKQSTSCQHGGTNVSQVMWLIVYIYTTCPTDTRLAVQAWC